MGKQKKKNGSQGRVLATNRKAFHEFHVLDRYEAGIALVGTEVKSLRAGKASFQDAYCQPREGEVWLLECHISPYDQGSIFNHEPKRPRRLLLNKREIKKLTGAVTEKGFTVVPLRFYLKGPIVKVEIALARGKHFYDKRETKRRKDIDRETDRAMKEYR